VSLLHALTSLFGSFLLLGIIAAGFLMMFTPARAWQLLKNLAVALALFVVGSMLASWLCPAYFK
jgi:hypothetical protein